MAGRVYANYQKANKPGQQTACDAEISIKKSLKIAMKYFLIRALINFQNSTNKNTKLSNGVPTKFPRKTIPPEIVNKANKRTIKGTYSNSNA